MNLMTLRSAPDGWHYGIEFDDPDTDNIGGLLTEPVDVLVARHNIRHVDVREDVAQSDTDVLVAAAGRRLRSALRFATEDSIGKGGV